MNDITLEKLLELGFHNWMVTFYDNAEKTKELCEFDRNRREAFRKMGHLQFSVGGNDAFFEYDPKYPEKVDLLSSDGGDKSVVKENITSIEQIKKIIEALS